MTDVVLKDVKGGYNRSSLNSNFDELERAINDEVLHRKGGNNVMQQDLDMNGNDILNASTGTSPGSLATRQFVEDGDAKKLSLDGSSTMTGNLDLGGNKAVNVGKGVDLTDGVNLEQVQQLIVATGADAVIPLVHPRQLGDGSTTTFSTPAVGLPNINGNSFFVAIDGVTQRPTSDYSIDGSGNITFLQDGVADAPSVNAYIDITYFNPSTLGNPFLPVSTVANMRLTEPSIDGQQITLLGHTLAGIGGGTFYHDESDTSSADNNGTVIVTAGGKRWKRNSSHKSVAMFGGIGDKTTDDTLAVQATLDSLVDGDTLNFEGYVHSITNNTQVDTINELTVIGEGGGLFKSGTTSLFTDPMLSFLTCEDLSISGVLIQGSFSGTNLIAGDYGIRLRSCKRVKLTSSIFKDLGDSAWTVSTLNGTSTGKTASRDVTVDGNIFDNVWQTSTTGNSGGCTNYTFSNNVCNILGSVKFACRSDDAKNLVVTGNTITSSLGTGIELVGYTNVVISGNTITALEYGINIYTNLSAESSTSPLANITISSNSIVADTLPAVRVDTNITGLSEYFYTGIYIKGNYLENKSTLGGSYAISFVGGGVDDVNISDNNIKGGLFYSYNRTSNSLMVFVKGILISNNNVLHNSVDNRPFIYPEFNEIPKLSCIGNRVVSNGGLINVNTSASVLSDDMEIRDNYVESVGECIRTGFGNRHVITGNTLVTTSTTVDAVSCNPVAVYYGNNIIESARAGRAIRMDYATMTWDMGGNKLPSAGTASFYGGITDISGALTHTP